MWHVAFAKNKQKCVQNVFLFLILVCVCLLKSNPLPGEKRIPLRRQMRRRNSRVSVLSKTLHFEKATVSINNEA